MFTESTIDRSHENSNASLKKITFSKDDPISASLYNNILPVFLCAHCGLILENKKVWDKFKSKDTKSVNLSFFESLWHFPESDMLKLYTEDFKTLRYCCKMAILDSCLNVKRILQQQLERQNTKLVEVSKVLTESNKEFINYDQQNDSESVATQFEKQK